LCYRKWLILFSLKLQRDNWKNALTVDSPKGKTRKKLYLLPHCGDETTTYYNKANKINYCNIAPLKCYDGAVPQGYAIGTG
ncbi:hypothetical protein, partial [uncultured Bilophila sp.]|uniref:hypothetical protein n=1 Tax=uncultured Bilophila sp. TaxID=529385 RepID=UPI00266EA198